MQEIREAASKHPYLRNFPNSIGQRVRDLVAIKYLRHYEQDGKPVMGYYVK